MFLPVMKEKLGGIVDLLMLSSVMYYCIWSFID